MNRPGAHGRTKRAAAVLLLLSAVIALGVNARAGAGQPELVGDRHPQTSVHAELATVGRAPVHQVFSRTPLLSSALAPTALVVVMLGVLLLVSSEVRRIPRPHRWSRLRAPPAVR